MHVGDAALGGIRSGGPVVTVDVSLVEMFRRLRCRNNPRGY
jgi:hypothetical protein